MVALPYCRPAHTEIITHWWEKREGVTFATDVLPGYGLMAYHEEKPVGALFAYLTNSPIAWLAWPIAAPELPKAERDTAMGLLFAKIEEELRGRGYSMIFTTSGHPGVERRLIEHGYAKGDKDVTQYWKGIE